VSLPEVYLSLIYLWIIHRRFVVAKTTQNVKELLIFLSSLNSSKSNFDLLSITSNKGQPNLSVCLWHRETERQTDRQTEREREREIYI
jgi:hypothetical protein